MKTTHETIATIKIGLKTVSGIALGIGVGAIIGDMLKDSKTDAKGVNKLIIKLSALAITGMVTKMTADYVDGVIDEAFDSSEELIQKLTNLAEGKDEEEVTEIVTDPSIPSTYIFSTEEEAANALKLMKNTIDNNFTCSFAQFRLLADKHLTASDLKEEEKRIGWLNLDEAYVKLVSYAGVKSYVIQLPRMIQLE